MGFIEQTNINWRAGFRMDINGILNDLEAEYKADLKSSIDNFNTYWEVSDETMTDLRVVKGKLQMLLQVGYINEDEFNGMSEMAEEMRFAELERLEKEGEKDGSKEIKHK